MKWLIKMKLVLSILIVAGLLTVYAFYTPGFFNTKTSAPAERGLKLKVKDYRKVDEIFETTGVHSGLANKCFADESGGRFLQNLLDVLERYDVSLDLYKEMKEKFTSNWELQQLRWVGPYSSYQDECQRINDKIRFLFYVSAGWEEKLDAILKEAQN